jgi:TonB-linked SusC/RagA family outer membrane protein
MLGLLAGIGVAMVATPATAQAQNAILRGHVRADNGEAVAGANVYINELNMQAATNEAGVFVLTIPGERVRGQSFQLRVRAIGYRPNSRLITITAGEQTADFTLAADVNRLDEIVVTGVMEGTEKGKLPFAASTVDMADVPVPSVDPIRLLAGRVPGANITSASGRPGASASVILRGPTSINASGRDQGPLYIVDGIIISGALPDINPADVENVEVVKGAAASSLYGARAGNGVIQITTRSGRRSADGMSFNVRAETGGSDIEHPYDMAQTTVLMMDETNTRFCTGSAGGNLCGRTIDWLTEAARVNNEPGDFALTPVSFPLDPGAATPSAALRNTFQSKLFPGRTYNAVDMLVQPQSFLQGTVDMTGRFNQTSVFASASALDQGGAIRFLNGFQRYTGRVNVDQRIGTQWSVALRTYYSRNHQDGLNQETGNNDAFFRITRQRAIENLLQRDTLGRLYIRSDMQGGGSQNENPLVTLENYPDQATTDRFLGGLTLRYSPFAWMDVEGNASYDLRNYGETFFRDKGARTTAANAAFNNGRVFQENDRSQGMNASFSANFRKNFGRNIQSHYSLRYLYEQQDSSINQGAGNTLAAVGVPQLGNATTGQTIFSAFQTQRQIGIFAGAGFDFLNGRYGVDGLIRRDGSSLFGANNRWQTFGRISGYWNVALEPWWFAPNTFSALKLRASHGSAGGRPRFSAQYETWTVSSSGVSFGNLGNVNLKPEVTIDNELGADIELFRRALFTITYDMSKTNNQILQVPNSAGFGFTTQWQNAGILSNKTLELSLNLPVVQKRNVNWTWTFTYDRTRTMVDSIAVPPFAYGGTGQGATTMFLLNQGERFATIYGRKFVTSCDQLPPTQMANCGGAGTAEYQANDEGFIVWVGAGNSYRDGITHNLYQTANPSATSPWGFAVNFGMPIIIRDTACVAKPSSSCAARQVPLGNGLPDWQFAIGQNFQYRRFSVYALLQGVMGREVFNEGRHWAHLDFLSADIDQRGRDVEVAKPIGYYWRVGSPENVGIGGFYDILGPNSYTVETTSYAKLRELSLGYNVGPVAGVGNWTVSLVGRNLFTITNYLGFDPEVGQGGGTANSAAINAVDAFAFPNTRSFTFALSTSF